MAQAGTHEIPGYEYIGDVDVLNGGRWIGVAEDTLGHVIEYVSSADYDGNGMMTASDVYCRSLADVRRALAACGWGVRLSTVRDRAVRHSLLIEALYQYGYYDPSNVYPDYHIHEWDREPSEADVIDQANDWAR